MKRAAIIVFAAWAVASCDSRKLECGERGNNANVSGRWLLEAEGERQDCPSGDERAVVKLASRRSLEVSQAPTSAQLDELFLATPIPGFDFSGTVEGGCVDFDTHETDAGVALSFSFSGHIDGSAIDGDFTETTAQICRTEGSFTVEITAGSDWPEADGGPRDDGAPADGGGADGGDTAGGDARPGDDDEPPADPYRPPHECYSISDCERGDCIDYRCVDLCQANTDCLVGETCVDGRCEEAPGCGCRGAGGVPAVVLGLLWLCRPGRRRCRG